MAATPWPMANCLIDDAKAVSKTLRAAIILQCYAAEVEVRRRGRRAAKDQWISSRSTVGFEQVMDEAAESLRSSWVKT
jgi:hypothetical protein